MIRTIGQSNSRIMYYNKQKMFKKTLEFYDRMQVKPNPKTFSCLFYSAAQLGELEQCKKLYNDLIQTSIDLDKHPLLQVNLINAFSKCHDMLTSQKVFDQLTQPRPIGVYNTLMKGYNIAQKPLITLKIFDEISQPDSISYLIGINAAAQVGMQRRARCLYKRIQQNLRSYETNLRIMSALIDMFGKSADIERAEEVFHSIKTKDLIVYNTLMNAYGRNGDGMKALEIYRVLSQPDEKSYSIILNACSHSLLIDQARQIFDSIPQQHRNVFVYATMIDALCRASRVDEAQQILIESERIHPKYPPMYITLLTAYARQQNLEQTLEIHRQIKEYFSDNLGYISSATILLANAYAYLGNLSEAIRLRTNNPTKYPGISWTETFDGQIHEFIAHDKRHAQTNEIYDELKSISNELKTDGYTYDERWITSDRRFNEHYHPLDSHSERLALAYQLFLRRKQPHELPIQITKNLRICGDCHEIFKRMTRIHRNLVLLVRDRTRQHRFQHGQCTCHDYF